MRKNRRKISKKYGPKHIHTYNDASLQTCSHHKPVYVLCNYVSACFHYLNSVICHSLSLLCGLCLITAVKVRWLDKELPDVFCRLDKCEITLTQPDVDQLHRMWIRSNRNVSISLLHHNCETFSYSQWPDTKITEEQTVDRDIYKANKNGLKHSL